MSLSDKIVKRVARKDKEDPFVETILQAEDVRAFIRELKGYANSVELGLIVIPTEKLDELAGNALNVKDERRET